MCASSRLVALLLLIGLNLHLSYSKYAKLTEKPKHCVTCISRPINYTFKIKEDFFFWRQPVENVKMDEKTSDFLIRLRSQRPSSRAVALKSQVD